MVDKAHFYGTSLFSLVQIHSSVSQLARGNCQNQAVAGPQAKHGCISNSNLLHTRKAEYTLHWFPHLHSTLSTVRVAAVFWTTPVKFPEKTSKYSTGTVTYSLLSFWVCFLLGWGKSIYKVQWKKVSPDWANVHTMTHGLKSNSDFRFFALPDWTSFYNRT